MTDAVSRRDYLKSVLGTSAAALASTPVSTSVTAYQENPGQDDTNASTEAATTFDVNFYQTDLMADRARDMGIDELYAPEMLKYGHEYTFGKAFDQGGETAYTNFTAMDNSVPLRDLFDGDYLSTYNAFETWEAWISDQDHAAADANVLLDSERSGFSIGKAEYQCDTNPEPDAALLTGADALFNLTPDDVKDPFLVREYNPETNTYQTMNRDLLVLFAGVHETAHTACLEHEDGLLLEGPAENAYTGTVMTSFWDAVSRSDQPQDDATPADVWGSDFYHTFQLSDASLKKFSL